MLALGCISSFQHWIELKLGCCLRVAPISLCWTSWSWLVPSRYPLPTPQELFLKTRGAPGSLSSTLLRGITRLNSIHPAEHWLQKNSLLQCRNHRILLSLQVSVKICSVDSSVRLGDQVLMKAGSSRIKTSIHNTCCGQGVAVIHVNSERWPMLEWSPDEALVP